MSPKPPTNFTFGVSRRRRKTVPVLLVLIFSIVLIYELSSMNPSNLPQMKESQTNDYFSTVATPVDQEANTNTNQKWNYQLDPLGIPPGKAQNLPSVRVIKDDAKGGDSVGNDENVDAKRNIYGGIGDKKHLGGFTNIDLDGITPNLWANLIQKYGVRSFLDVGCGKGVSTRWFLEHGADVLCVEGSHDAVSQSILPKDKVVEHDYSRGPWWPEKTYDIAWSVEFLEHVSRQYHFNYMSTFRKAALIFVTSSRWGGWHHVEIHPDEWWIRKIELYGFKYEPELTREAKSWASQFYGNYTEAPNGKQFVLANHPKNSLKVFSNSRVAALPEHAHLFPRPGCFVKYSKGGAFISETRPCGITPKFIHQETKLPDTYEPLVLLPEMQERWNATVAASLINQ